MFKFVSFDEFVLISDVIIIYVLLILEIDNLFDKDVLSCMKKYSYLVNIVCGKIVNCDVLVEVLVFEYL